MNERLAEDASWSVIAAGAPGVGGCFDLNTSPSFNTLRLTRSELLDHTVADVFAEHKREFHTRFDA